VRTVPVDLKPEITRDTRPAPSLASIAHQPEPERGDPPRACHSGL